MRSADPNAAQRLFLALLREETMVNQVNDAKRATTLHIPRMRRTHREVEELFFARQRRVEVRPPTPVDHAFATLMGESGRR
jgi:hypothetical protein